MVRSVYAPRTSTVSLRGPRQPGRGGRPTERVPGVRCYRTAAHSTGNPVERLPGWRRYVRPSPENCRCEPDPSVRSPQSPLVPSRRLVPSAGRFGRTPVFLSENPLQTYVCKKGGPDRPPYPARSLAMAIEPVCAGFLSTTVTIPATNIVRYYRTRGAGGGATYSAVTGRSPAKGPARPRLVDDRCSYRARIVDRASSFADSIVLKPQDHCEYLLDTISQPAPRHSNNPPSGPHTRNNDVLVFVYRPAPIRVIERHYLIIFPLSEDNESISYYHRFTVGYDGTLRIT